MHRIKYWVAPCHQINFHKVCNREEPIILLKHVQNNIFLNNVTELNFTKHNIRYSELDRFYNNVMLEYLLPD